MKDLNFLNAALYNFLCPYFNLTAIQMRRKSKLNGEELAFMFYNSRIIK